MTGGGVSGRRDSLFCWLVVEVPPPPVNQLSIVIRQNEKTRLGGLK
jgi:hypothetical protein